ncbi:MAG: hydroxymethylglutaryl-CoA lyase [Candidatus Marinimicrobia bacterium]|nr:hydroxymethylglutaryl-CoA lyase [Candidatus Neomarinimicrobiota bacterium]MBT3502304.1 hydroxymethylglutaryl-CoA lyase [Candidatus Neomarinimicrobiota bacterium]MBT3840414.1 hydroxymethylglutaryl-CoA lyase [Candidatus Neomarinimicrobiota bacterium]MBT3999479.1 hydroxymethylglutaryl-CoA lyase [Candidatus Neomarinimicrobiota bacterium]MBT4282072.1 hydroxymethylglutaryl-CoA lyase [Candidatus Neomarinimicrobiota bacterium]
MSSYPSSVKLVEVGPRDGLQSIVNIISTEEKVNYINLLSDAGMQEIEVTSFVSPKWIPQLADATDVSILINQIPDTCYTALVPNLHGLKNAVDSKYKSVAVFTTVSETFSQKNTNCSIQESFKRLNFMQPIWEESNLRVRGYISTVWHCPYEGIIQYDSILDSISKYLDLGITEISLGDTIGKATPDEVRWLLDKILAKWPPNIFALHFHDTFGSAEENIQAGLEFEISIFDGSTGGIGGCPYAEGSSGNIATEAINSLCNSLGIETGIQPEKLNIAANFIQNLVNKESRNYAKD